MKKSKGTKGGTSVHLTSKPFCDCAQCKCKDCPDVKDLLSSLPVKSGKPKKEKISKGTSSKRAKVCQSNNEVKDLSLMDIIMKNKNCNCEVMARALRSNINLNVNTSEQKEKPTEDP